jgi:hypothetical protein
MERRVLALMYLTLAAAACAGPPDGGSSMLQSEFQQAAVDEPDGRVSLYSGHLIADALGRLEDVENLSFMTAFLRVRVPRSLLEMVPTSLDQPAVISLEQEYPGVEILLHDFDYTSLRDGRATQMTNTTFIPGDPWLTGHAQVLRDRSCGFVGGAHIVKYSGGLPLGTADISWGMVSCTGGLGCPQLRYANPNPCLWPAVPTNWVLAPQPDGPATLDALCNNM